MHYKPLALATTTLLTLAGCDLIELATSDRPDSTQRAAIGEIFTHMADVGTVLGDPTSVSEAKLVGVFDPQPYVKLIAPDLFSTTQASALETLNATLPQCVTVEGKTATFDCEVTIETSSCRVTGDGSEEPENTYSGNLNVVDNDDSESNDGPKCPSLGLTGAFTLDPKNNIGTGALQLTRGGDGAFDITVDLGGLTFCADGLPNGGSLRVTGSGRYGDREYDGTVTVNFTEADGNCGVATLD